jgi:predicted RNase H-like HicB family nuclease
MLTYKAAYKDCDDGIHGEVLDFPGVMTCGATLPEVRRLLASALTDMAQLELESGSSLPQPNPHVTAPPDFDLEEPIRLSQ